MATLLPSKPANFGNLAHCAFLSCSPNRAATDSRDENLKAKSPVAAGGSKEERYAKVEVMSSSLVSEAG